MFVPQEGQYYYAPHRAQWGVWRKGKTANGVSMDDFVCDFPTKTKANDYVRYMNGWSK